MTDISKTEFEVLEAMWSKHPASAQDVIERLNRNKPWHEKTVKTLINRMVKKGALGFEKQGRQYLYFPMFERETYTLKESSNLINRIFGGKVAPLVAGFAKHQELSKSDVDELKALISKWEQEND